jgi:hypothetical protein
MKALVSAPIRFYRRYLSGLKRVPTCRFVPTCSEYALEAIEKRGALVGTLKAIWRLLRCNPLCRGGYDPVDGGAPARDHRHQLGCGHAGERMSGRDRPVAGHP